MKKTGNTAKKVAMIGVLAAMALILSYVESCIPFDFAVPGIKLGLANLLVVIALYYLDIPSAVAVSFVRILLSAMLFSNVLTLSYSLAGGILSLCMMILCKKLKLSVIGVSVAGGVFHNVGQVLVAMFVMGTSDLIYWLIVLLIVGVVTGMLIGIAASLVLKKLPKNL